MALHGREIDRFQGVPTRVVDSIWIEREPLAFRALCQRAVPPETRLLVLDLDRTLHLGRNMGELLGWEISAYHGYGPSYLTQLEPRRGCDRVFLAKSRPLAAMRYLWKAGRAWIPSGLLYLLWCKIAAHVNVLRRRSYLRFGSEPVQAVQRFPQYALFRQIASLPDTMVRELATRVWRRHQADQTIEREDIDWLRRRCPSLRVVLSSASPQQVVEVAAGALGIEEVIGSSLHRINGGHGKLEELRRRYPELGAPDAVTVGISDTGYGEDHCWTEAFTRLVDVNSSWPFPPIVSGTSPLRAIFSAPILTRAEKEARARGERSLDPRRAHLPGGRGREFRGPELDFLLAPLRETLDRLSRELDDRRRGLARALQAGRAACADADRVLESIARAIEEQRWEPSRRSRRNLLEAIRQRLSLQLRLARATRPLSEVAFSIARTLERSRQLLEDSLEAR